MGIARPLAAETAAGILTNENQLRGIYAEELGDPWHRERYALRGAMQVQLPVLPVGHRRARLHRMVGQRLGYECLFQDKIGLFEAGFDIAVLPLLSGFPHGQLALINPGKITRRPFDCLEL